LGLIAQGGDSQMPNSPPSTQQGNRIILNDRAVPGVWTQRRSPTDKTAPSIGISDSSLMQSFGVDLLNTKDATKQPVQWFAQSLALNTWLTPQYRYLDVTQLARQAGWQLQAEGTTLRITSPVAQIVNVRQGRQTFGSRAVIDLTQATPWQVEQQGQDLLITLDAKAEPELLKRFQPGMGAMARTIVQPGSSITIETTQNRSLIKLKVPDNLRPQISTLANPPRLIVDLTTAGAERDILWAPGLRWRQQTLTIGASRFPIVWLVVNLRQPGLTLAPIWTGPQTLVGIAPLPQMAQGQQAVAAINGGFFNRNTKLPLGAIRLGNRWISSPILNRGAIGWSRDGIKMGRLSLQQTLITATGQRFPILSLNSGYVQAGIARYTPEWGAVYTPLTDNEIIATVQNDRIIDQRPANKTLVPIPANSYLLIFRSNKGAASALPVGTAVKVEMASSPSEFDRYPQILGAGPLLVQNRQIVLDAKAEQFSAAFIRETAVRSAIGTTPEGTLLIAAVQNSIGGTEATLGDMAQIMQQLGAVEALNLDGGSSTTLYLGGQVLNRSPRTVARVHNGLGIFIQPGAIVSKLEN